MPVRKRKKLYKAYVTVPVKADWRRFIERLIDEGYADSQADFCRKAIKRELEYWAAFFNKEKKIN